MDQNMIAEIRVVHERKGVHHFKVPLERKSMLLSGPKSEVLPKPTAANVDDLDLPMMGHLVDVLDPSQLEWPGVVHEENGVHHSEERDTFFEESITLCQNYSVVNFVRENPDLDPKAAEIITYFYSPKMKILDDFNRRQRHLLRDNPAEVLPEVDNFPKKRPVPDKLEKNSKKRAALPSSQVPSKQKRMPVSGPKIEVFPKPTAVAPIPENVDDLEEPKVIMGHFAEAFDPYAKSVDAVNNWTGQNDGGAPRQ